jgi:hypothetical protein
MVGVIEAGAGAADPPLEPGVDVLVPAGPDGVAPPSRPVPAGAMYVVAETVAVICGKPVDAAPSEIELMLKSRPLTVISPLRATTKRSSRLKKSDRWKKLPVKLKVNCSVGKPADPIEAPGGSAPADTVLPVEELAGVELEEPAGVELEEPEELEEVEELEELEEVEVVGAGVAPPPFADICRVRKSTLAALAAAWIW